MDALESDYSSKDVPSTGQKARGVAPPLKWAAREFFAPCTKRNICGVHVDQRLNDGAARIQAHVGLSCNKPQSLQLIDAIPDPELPRLCPTVRYHLPSERATQISLQSQSLIDLDGNTLG